MPKTPKTPPAQAPESHKKAQVSQLMQSLGQSAKAKAPVSSDLLHRQMDLSHYKNQHAHPGAKYFLVGDSYYVQGQGKGANAKGSATAAKKRAAAINGLFGEPNAKGQHNYQKLSSALKDKQFFQSLSRFEQQWLSHEPTSSLIGPAYDQHGKPISGVFAVWRLESVHNQRAQTYNYSNPKAQYSQPQQGQQKSHKRLAAAR